MQANSSEFLQRLSGAIEDVAHSTSESVVTVERDGRSSTGVVVDREGHILTANHVVQRLDETEVVTPDGKRLTAKVAGRNVYADLALLKTEVNGLRPIEFGESGDLKVGQFVLALARPQAGSVGVTSGIITGVNRQMGGWWRFSVRDAIVTDARLNPGYSGGPLVDASGRMVGMNVAYVMNRGIAVSAGTIRRSLEKMAKGESVKRAYLGIVSSPIELPEGLASRPDICQETALMVYSVEPGSAARAAGVAFGDVLLKLGEQRLTAIQDLESVLDEDAIGRKAKLVVLRGEQLKELAVAPAVSR
ncbi:MAG: trypsin-like peptidase domain-containing protein [Nitrososphaerota archaeon]|nr:trypsin-like peptidase domain-containing protein [Nitrososphaerota archaeon]